MKVSLRWMRASVSFIANMKKKAKLRKKLIKQKLQGPKWRLTGLLCAPLAEVIRGGVPRPLPARRQRRMENSAATHPSHAAVLAPHTQRRARAGPSERIQSSRLEKAQRKNNDSSRLNAKRVEGHYAAGRGRIDRSRSCGRKKKPHIPAVLSE